MKDVGEDSSVFGSNSDGARGRRRSERIPPAYDVWGLAAGVAELHDREGAFYICRPMDGRSQSLKRGERIA